MKQLEKFDFFKKKINYEELLSDAFLSFLKDVLKTTPLKISKIEGLILITYHGIEGRIAINKKPHGVEVIFNVSNRGNSDVVTLNKFFEETFKEYYYGDFFEIPNEDIPEVIKKLNADEFEFNITANRYNL